MTGGGVLTARRRQILDTIRAAIARDGYPPTVREIGAAVGLSSPSAVAYQLAALERAGYLHRRPGSARALTLPPSADGVVGDG